MASRSSSYVASLSFVALLLVSGRVLADTTELESVASGGTPASGYVSGFASLSADGRYIAIESLDTTLVPGDTNGFRDIFLRDTKLNTTIKVSKGFFGAQSDGESVCPWTSNDGRYVAFSSYASDLVTGDFNDALDCFVWDRTTQKLTLVSATPAGVQGDYDSVLATMSADGRYLAFESYADNLVPNDTNNAADIFVRDLLNGTIERISTVPAALGGGEGNSDSLLPIIATGGRYVVFSSYASNLAPNDTNNAQDVFRYDLVTHALDRVSVATNGAGANGESRSNAWSIVSADGRYVVFHSDATNLVPNDTNGTTDVFVRDMVLGVTTRVSVGANGNEAHGESKTPSLSADGRYVTFESAAPDLVPGDGNGTIDVFRKDLYTGNIVRVSVTSTGLEGHGASYYASCTSDGRTVVYTSTAPDLVANDLNANPDVFAFRDTWNEFHSYGTGLAGSAGIVPTLLGANGSAAQGGAAIGIQNCLGGANGMLFVAAQKADIFPVFGGHLLVSLASPFVMLNLPVSGPSGLPGFGGVGFSTLDTHALAGYSLYFQFLVIDPGAVKGVAMSNGLELDVAN